MEQGAAVTATGDDRVGRVVDLPWSSRLERIATGFFFVEGPSWSQSESCLYFSDIVGNAMYRWTEQQGATVFRKPSNKANGTTWDQSGGFLVCEHSTSRLIRIDRDGAIQVLASHYGGRELNSPNDVVVKSNGDIYFTDPASGRSARYGVERPQQLDFQGVFRLCTDGRLELLADDFILPNGLCFSPDESLLYVNDTREQHIRVFEVRDDGTLSGGSAWAETGGAAPGVADGMKVDSEGHVYSCGSGGIHVFRPDSTRLGVIETPEVAANFTWGGPDLTHMYITATQSLYRLQVRIPGRVPVG